MTGSVSFKIHGDYRSCELLKKLIHYSYYSGIGSRKALGMGGDEQKDRKSTRLNSSHIL